MKRLFLAFSFLLVAAAAHAQTPIVIGPNSSLAWGLPNVTQAVALSCTYNVSVDNNTTFAPVVGPIVCADPVAPSTTAECSANLMAQSSIKIGSGSITMTVTCNGLTSLPSIPFNYLDVVIPIPSNVRIKH